MSQKYDIIVSTADISGCEAAFVSSKMGARVLLITPDIDTIANLYFGNKLGGGEKGIIIREIDALGGMISKIADISSIHFMTDDYFQSPVALCDRYLFTLTTKKFLFNSKNLDILEDEIIEILCYNSESKIILTRDSNSYETKCLILTSLNNSLSECMKKYGFKIYETITVIAPVLDSSSISFDELISQKSVNKPVGFSYIGIKPGNKLVDFWQLKIDKMKMECLTEKILNDFKSSDAYHIPFSKRLSTDSDKEHVILFFPFGYDDFRIYLEGLEMFLPRNIQERFIHNLDGCKNAKVIKYGHLLKFHSCGTPLKRTFEVSDFPGLFLIGFANGTTGYEESAAEGFIAGVNAALKIKQKSEFIPPENLSIIGTLLLRLAKKTFSPIEEMRNKTSDKITYVKDIRPDNADIRLLHYGYELGLIERRHYESFLKYKQLLESELNLLKNTVFPGSNVSLATLIKEGTSYKSIRIQLDKIAKRKKIPYNEDYYRDLAPWNWRRIENEIEYTLRNEK